MPLHRPQELRRFLEELGVSPKKALSQNFLIDGNIIDKLATAAPLQPGDQVLEIGPGPGALTERMLEMGAQVTAVERDTTFANALSRLDPTGKQLRVIEADVMKVDPTELFEKGPVKLIANLPYQLTSPILGKFLPLFPLFSHIVVMIQDEVARRMTAKAGSGDYGHLTLSVDAYSRSRYVAGVSPNSFFPPPKVRSAIVAMELCTPPLQEMEPFWQMTKRAFQQRRKMLRGSLRELYDAEKIRDSLEKCGFEATVRPEQLSIDQFVALFEELGN